MLQGQDPGSKPPCALGGVSDCIEVRVSSEVLPFPSFPSLIMMASWH